MMDVERESVDSDSMDKHRILVQTMEKAQDIITESGGRQYLNTTGYYILDVLSGDVSTLPCTVQDIGDSSSMVALGSRIYIFGMPINNSNAKKPSSSYFLDFTNSSKSFCWKRACPLIRPQSQLALGCAVAFGGKMYFFGDSDFEVFDPTTTQPKPNWRRIKSTPPGAQWLVPPVLADHKNDRIIVFFDNTSSVYAYYPSREQWECVVERFGNWFSYFEPVTLVDGVIYLHSPQLKDFFMAYDLATKEWLNVQVSPDAGTYQSHLPLCSYDSLLHLGNGILCLLASCYKDLQTDPQTQTTLVHVVRFKVQLNDTKKVLVTPLSSQYYDLHSPCKLFSCLAL